MQEISSGQLPYLIVGCGYLGRRVAALWRGQGKRVAALTRSRADELRGIGVEPIHGDILDRSSLTGLPPSETLLYAVGWDRSSGRSFREVHLDGLRNVISAAPRPERVVYISSTSVYAQANGEEIDERSPAEPLEENGRILLDAELLLRERWPQAVILRFAGIYGPARIIRRAAIENGEALAGDPDKWLNLIHVDDGARAVLAADQRPRSPSGDIFLVSDDQPVQRRQFYSLAAELLHAPPPSFEAILPGTPVSSHERGNRRICNRKLHEELGLKLLYPDFRSGLRASI